MAATDDRSALVHLLTEAVPYEDYDYIDGLVHPEVVLPEMPGGGQGVEGYKQGLRAYAAAMEHESITAEDVVADGDKVAVRLVVKGRHTGPLMGVPPTGKAFTVDQMIIAQFRDGLIVRFWNVADRLSLARQLAA
jgi:predicted ester cyclase